MVINHFFGLLYFLGRRRLCRRRCRRSRRQRWQKERGMQN